MHDLGLQNERWPILAEEFANISKVSGCISFRMHNAAFCQLLTAKDTCLGKSDLLFAEMSLRKMSV
jgi:hypothetical protein